MNKFFSLVLFLSFGYNAFAQINIIPQPNQIELKEGGFKLNSSVEISYNDADSKKTAELFRQFLKDNYRLELNLKQNSKAKNLISFSSSSVSDNREAYHLNISSNKIEISGKEAGLFYGFQSLIQLFPLNDDKEIQLQNVSIKDEPRLKYRGLHLDVCRHFFPVDFLKKYIDVIASYKLNVFHWHLTEDQGWRIEIKKYPKLTEIGAYRAQTLIGNYKVEGDYDGIPYGGFYSQDEIREVVAYAKERFVTVIPEIELPGHAQAALASYNHLGCGDNPGPFKTVETWGVFDEVFCAGKETTFEFLEDVFDEVLELFPSEYIHIGGDECPKTRWKTCPHCQKRIKDNNLKDEHELQSYFIRRIEKYLNSKGRKIIGWDEILEGGLAPNATVMSWRGEDGGIAAARQGHDFIITANSYGLYFDHSQGADRTREPLSIGGYSTLEKVYNSDPMPKGLSENEQKYLLGVQANVWTEYIETTNKVEFIIFPRVFALSEIAWTQPKNKNWKDFSEKRTANHLARFDKSKKYVFRVPEVYGITEDTIKGISEYTFKNLVPSVEGAKLYYTIDGYNPSELDLEFKDEVTVKIPKGSRRVFKVTAITPAGRKSNYTQVILINE